MKVEYADADRVFGSMWQSQAFAVDLLAVCTVSYVSPQYRHHCHSHGDEAGQRLAPCHAVHAGSLG